jgi:hypothetical protein
MRDTAKMILLAAALFTVAPHAPASAGETPAFTVELEGAALWQTKNDVEIPNDGTGTRFSIIDVTGKGAWPAGRLYLTWNINDRHSLRALLAPLSISESGQTVDAVDFAGERYLPGEPLEATYQFNSWRLSYRYRYLRREDLSLWVGFTAKIRDARIELSQGAITSRDTDVGFVPLLYLAADWRFADCWHLLFDFNGLAGGPGRAFDVALKLGYDISDRWGLTAGYRTIEGGADVEAVYNFAWLHYAAGSVVLRF